MNGRIQANVAPVQRKMVRYLVVAESAANGLMLLTGYKGYEQSDRMPRCAAWWAQELKAYVQLWDHQGNIVASAKGGAL